MLVTPFPRFLESRWVGGGRLPVEIMGLTEGMKSTFGPDMALQTCVGICKNTVLEGRTQLEIASTISAASLLL